MKSMGFLRRFAPILIVTLMALPSAFAQQVKPPVGSGGSKGDTSKPPVTPQPTDNSRPQKLNPQALFIYGVVVQEDGNPLPPGAVIERVCGGRAKKEAYVTTTGSFEFQIGGTMNASSVIPEAGDDSLTGFGTFGSRSMQSGGQGSAFDPMSASNLMGCEVRARLSGYRSSSVILDGSHQAGQFDVGTILLTPISRVPGTVISLTDMRAPKEAKKSLERANKALEKKNLPEAERNLKTAVEAFPDYASAWYKLGLVYQQQKRNQDARDAFNKAIAADSKFVNPYFQLARIAGIEQKWQEVADITDRALALDPLDFPEGYYFNSLAYYVMNKLDIAERSARKAQRLDSLHRIPRINVMLADILEKKRDFAGSIEQLQAYLNFSPTPADADRIRLKIQKLEDQSKSLASNPPENAQP